MAEKLTLYTYWRSSCSWRVKWAMEYKGVPYREVAVNLLKDEQKSAAHLKRNPSGQVPVLEVGGAFFAESLAILEWLEEAYPTPGLLPNDRQERMWARQLALNVIAATQPLQNMKAKLFFSADKDEQARYMHHWIENGLTAHERLLAMRPSGTFSLGGILSLADIALVPQVYNAIRHEVSLSAMPRCVGIYERCLELKSCKNTFPKEPGK